MIILMSKKTASQKLYAKRPLFFNIGLVLALLLCVFAFEYRFYVDAEEMVELTTEDPVFSASLDDPIPTKQPPKVKPLPPKEKKIEYVIKEAKAELIPEKQEKPDIDALENELDDLMGNDKPIEIVPDNTIHDVVESMPEFKGGEKAFYEYLSKNIEYPKREQRMGIDGRVYITFVIERDGSLSDIQVLKGISTGLDEEAIRVLKEAPSWIPGKQRGQPVRVKMTIPINFQLQ